MKKNLSFIAVTLSCFLITSCTSNDQRLNDNRDISSPSILNNTDYNQLEQKPSFNNVYDPQKQFFLPPIKYYDYQKYDDKGQIISVPLSGIAGRFAWEEDCLVFISAYGGARATPLLPYGITHWNNTEKTITINNTVIKMGDLIEAGGVFVNTPSNQEVICFNHPYIVSVQVMGGIQILENEKELSFGTP